VNSTEILAGLEDARPELREQAIAQAAQGISPEVLGRLVGDHENAVLRNWALAALERQGPYATPHLVTLARGSDLEVAMFAVQILSRIKDPATVAALLPLVEHPDSNIAQAAIEALGALKAREAVPALIHRLDADLWLQFAAVAALGEIGDARAALPLLDAIPNEMLSEPAVEALGRIAAPESLPRLLALLADHDRLPLRDFVLRAAALVLEGQEIPPSVFTRFRRKLQQGEARQEAQLTDYLAGLIGSSEKALSRAAASLALAAELSALYPLVVQRALDDDAEEARWTAALCRRHERTLRSALLGLLRHPDPRVRRAALLATHGDVATVLPLLQDPDLNVRAAACHALGRSRDVSAIPALVSRLAQGSPQEAAAAAEALGCMPGQSLLALAPFLETPERVLLALGVLEAARSPLFESRVLELLDAETAPVRRAALRALVNLDHVDFEEHLVRKLEDPDALVRIEAVELIVRNGSSARAVPALVGLLVVGDELRYHVIRALGRLRATAAAPALEALFARAAGHERLEVVAALIRIAAPGILPFLQARLAEADAEVRRVAADGLARVATAAELPLLVRLARDPDWNIRNHAGWGLGRLGLGAGREALLLLVRDAEPVVARTARAALAKLPA
jgi:HEAT repeat protein